MISSKNSFSLDKNNSMNRKNAQWMKYSKLCRSYFLNHDSKLSSFYKKNNIELAGVDYLKTHFLAGTPCSTTHLFWLVLEGEVYGDVGEGFKIMKRNSFLISPAGSPHWIELRSASAKGLWFHFSPTSRWQKLEQVKEVFPASSAASGFNFLIQDFLMTSEFQYPLFDLARSYAMELLMIKIEMLVDAFHQIKEPHFLSKIRELEDKIFHNLKSHWNVQRLSSLMNMSSSHFHRKIIQYLNVSPMEFVLEKRIAIAKNLLLRTDKKISEIAEEVGFLSPFSFSNSFKRVTGSSPQSYRSCLK